MLSGVTINKGDNSVCVGIYDFEFKNRVSDECIDIGALEFSYTVS